MSTPRITAAHADGVGRVTFDRAERGNSFTAAGLVELVDAITRVAAEPSVAVIRLEMAGRHFCAGWDTGDFGSLASAPAEEIITALRDNDTQLARLGSLPVPVVAGVCGRVAGFGLGLLASVSVPIAAVDATAALPEVAHRICPGGVLHTLLNRIPGPAVRLLATSGLPVSAGDLLSWGLVARVVQPEDLEVAVEEVVHAIAAQAPATVRSIMQAAQTSVDSPQPAYAAAAASLRALSPNPEEGPS